MIIRLLNLFFRFELTSKIESIYDFSKWKERIIERFVSAAKNLLMQNVTEMLQQWYGIWADGHTIGVEQLPSQDTDIVHTARMLRDRLQHLMAALPDTDTDADKSDRL